MKKQLILLAGVAILSLIPFRASAQRQEYGYPHAIDMQIGYTVTPYSVAGESRTAHGLADGTSFSIRYTGFVTPRFGVFAEIGTAYADAREDRYFAVVNRADGGKYRYMGETYPYDAAYEPVFKAGAAYRYDVGQFSLRTRVGLGTTTYVFDSHEYTRVDRRTGDSQNVLVRQSDLNRDYLIDSDDFSGSFPKLVLGGSVQLTYTFFQHFYLSAEAGLDLVPARYASETHIPGEMTLTVDNSFIPDMLSMKFGIGWNIGWNRNSRSYSRYGHYRY